MKKLGLSLLFLFIMIICSARPAPPVHAAAASRGSGPFTAQELQDFAAIGPIDTHTHVSQGDPAFYAMLKRLHLHILNIMLVDDHDPELKDLNKERKDYSEVVRKSDGYAALCTTFDPFQFGKPDFAQNAIRGLNRDFSNGAIAVKIWKNIGMEIKDTKGNYIMPDNPAFEPIYKDIAAHNKTLIAHVADPDTIWQAPNPKAADYSYYTHHPELYMYGKPGVPSKQEILVARDHMLQENPNLRVVGAHIGSMEVNLSDVANRFDKYPNFAVDLAARMVYLEMKPRDQVIAFLTKYQDRIIYGTDNGFEMGTTGAQAVQRWEERYANDWRYLATNGTVMYQGRAIRGLALPPSILRKIFHDNAVKWFPGILASSTHS